MTEFEMTYLGLMLYYLGIEVVQSVAGAFICQRKYVQDILKKVRMENCNLAKTLMETGLKLVKSPEGENVNSTFYKQIVGSLMYLTATMPDIMYALSVISTFMENPKEVHLMAKKNSQISSRNNGTWIILQEGKKIRFNGIYKE